MTATRKRMRLEDSGSSSEGKLLEPSATIKDLPSEVMKNIFSFVGKGNYCFVAPVSKDFCFNYLTMDVIEDKFAHKMDYLQAIGRNKITTAIGDVAPFSFDLAEYCFLYAPVGFQKEVVRNAIWHGKKDIVEMGHAMGVDIKESICWVEIKEAARRGDLEMFKLLQQKGVDFDFHAWAIIPAAAGNNQLEILKWLHENNWFSSSRCKEKMFHAAARSGHISIINWAKDVAGFDFPEYLISSAAASGNLNMIKYLRSKDISWDEYTFYDAAYSGNIALLQYLLDNECPRGDRRICISTGAVENNDHEKAMEVLQWLHSQGFPWYADTCTVAAKEGNLEALKYLKSNNCPWNQECMKKTLQSCNVRVEVLEFLFQNDCPIGNSDLCSIAMNDTDHDRALKILKLLREFSVPWSGQTCKAAAKAGNFTALQWAVSMGCPWDRQGCAEYAAEHGDIEVLKWMKSQGCEWDEDIGAGAAKKGHLETLKWLKSDGCPCNNEDTFANAIQSGNITMVEYCVNNDPSSDYSFYENAIEHFEDPIPVIKLFQKKQYPSDELACTHAACQGDLKLLRWLRFQGFPWDERTCNWAVQNNDFAMLKYAHENGCPWTKETYAYCFSEYGLLYETMTEEIPTDHQCSDEIIEYLQIHICPQPDPEDWIREFIGDY
ncbi:hypothetical protein CTEN210_09787 [Chaetoceros tenuissimus]|uniref:Uncharacterized protein n=1 Tax=Chaetoceros tenuissimus TaxID=426638 RepID=A0AAD3H7Q6_9STRA|nr:hypothetical protein CTEN210_09787 [Chaetoceros tenuissimus]